MDIHTISGADLIQTWRDYKRMGLSQRDLARDLHTTTGALRGKMYRSQLKIQEQPDLYRVDFGQPLELELEQALIFGDVHVPATDYDFAMLPVAIARKHMKKGKRVLIISGDLYNMDVASAYSKICQNPSLDAEIVAAEHLMEIWLKVFDNIIFLMGNHDRRISKKLEGEVHAKHLIHWLTKSPRVTASNFGWCVVHSGDGAPWRITHSCNYSINQLTVANVLAQKYQMNIISHHEHHLAKGWDRYGRYVIINNGGLFDEQKFAYVQLDDSKHNKMVKGFTLLRNGHADVFGESPFTDWEHWL